jgi:hypothetical protein
MATFITRLLSVFVPAVILAGCSLPFQSSQAGLQINADPQATVYIDDKHVGETNFSNDKLKPGDYIVRLSPLQDQQQTWETKIKVQPGLKSVINKTFGPTAQESSSYVLQLEKISNKKVAEVNIITSPENVIVRINDQPKGFSPLTNMSLSEENHKITLSAPGYKTLNFTASPVLGHRLIISAELGKSLALQPDPSPDPGEEPSATPEPDASPSPSPAASPSPTPRPSPSPSPTAAADPAKPYVEILTTPTGWLRVRSAPDGLADNEVARVNSGEKFPFIESTQTGWYKIEYTSGKQGWIAAQFARIVR